VYYINIGGKMHFKPFNRHIVVDLIEEKKEEKGVVILPTDYKKPASHYAKAIVIEASEDSKFHGTLFANDTVLVERRMLQKVEISEYTFYLVLENYIYGRINDEIDS
jgi:co-chaperonin GroES (HSP10)